MYIKTHKHIYIYIYIVVAAAEPRARPLPIGWSNDHFNNLRFKTSLEINCTPHVSSTRCA